MAEYSNDNSGALFRNEKKETDKHPDHTGNAKIGGVDYWISAWVKEKNGRKYFSLAFKPKEQRKPPENPAEKSWARPDYADEEIPF